MLPLVVHQNIVGECVVATTQFSELPYKAGISQVCGGHHTVQPLIKVHQNRPKV